MLGIIGSSLPRAMAAYSSLGGDAPCGMPNPCMYTHPTCLPALAMQMGVEPSHKVAPEWDGVISGISKRGSDDGDGDDGAGGDGAYATPEGRCRNAQ